MQKVDEKENLQAAASEHPDFAVAKSKKSHSVKTVW